MKTAECREFLAWALPRMGLQPAAFRKVRGQVCKRVGRRIKDLGISGHVAYRSHLDTNEDEWRLLDSLCRITITRFYREQDAWAWLRDAILPRLADQARAAGRDTLRAWSAGCGGGEEPYSLRILWELELARRFPSLRLEIVATDADAAMLRRARDAGYRWGTLREVPPALMQQAFEEDGAWLRLRPEYRAGVRFKQQDMRVAMPDGPFDLVLCRYLAFTYFDADGQRAALTGIVHRLRPGGILMLGAKEHPPSESSEIVPEHRELGFWRRRDGPCTPWPQAAP